jgi:hypothetical protein
MTAIVWMHLLLRFDIIKDGFQGYLEIPLMDC